MTSVLSLLHHNEWHCIVHPMQNWLSWQKAVHLILVLPWGGRKESHSLEQIEFNIWLVYAHGGGFCYPAQRAICIWWSIEKVPMNCATPVMLTTQPCISFKFEWLARQGSGLWPPVQIWSRWTSEYKVNTSPVAKSKLSFLSQIAIASCPHSNVTAQRPSAAPAPCPTWSVFTSAP